MNQNNTPINTADAENKGESGKRKNFFVALI